MTNLAKLFALSCTGLLFASLADCGNTSSSPQADMNSAHADMNSSPPDSAIAGPKWIFFTGLTYNGDLQTAGKGVTGLDGGDKLCNTWAQNIGLTGSYRAWLSDATTQAIDRITSNGPWNNLAGARVFDSKSQISSAPPTSPITDALMHNPSAPTWTGTTLTGMSSGNCLSWNSPLDRDSGLVGIGSQSEWSNGGISMDCSALNVLLCFEQ